MRPNRFIVAPAEPGATVDLVGSSPDLELEDQSCFVSTSRTLRNLSGSLLRILWGLFAVLGCAFGVTWAVYHYATTSPRFAIQEVRFEGESRLTHDQLLSESGIRIGDNLFKLNVGGVEKRLLRDSWISEVHVTRKLPTTIVVAIQEREATGLAMLGGRMFLVNRLGETFKALGSGDPSDLPLITGVSIDNASGDVGLDRQRLGLALDVLNQYARCRLAKTYPAEEVHLTPGGEVVLTVGHRGVALYLGTGPWPKKFAMAERIFAKLQAQRSTPAIIFLNNRAHQERVVVRLN
jgi:cell division protein FtsQ